MPIKKVLKPITLNNTSILYFGPNKRLQKRNSYYKNEINHAMLYLLYFIKNKKKSHKIVGFINLQVNLETI